MNGFLWFLFGFGVVILLSLLSAIARGFYEPVTTTVIAALGIACLSIPLYAIVRMVLR